jgi:hypothetical protein
MRGSFTMSEQDKYDKMAEELFDPLAASFATRVIVAVALRSQGEEIERLQTLDKTMANVHNSNLVEMANMREEISQLKAQLGALHGKIMNLEPNGPGITTRYIIGFSDARHQAAGLCAATAQPGPSGADSGVFNEVKRT